MVISKFYSIMFEITSINSWGGGVSDYKGLVIFHNDLE